MVLPERRDTEKIKQQVTELYNLEQEYKAYSKEYESKKDKLTVAIKNFMYCNKGAGDSFMFRPKASFGEEGRMLKVLKVSPVSIVWHAEELRKKLGKKICAQVVEKSYTINDMPGLVEYLKSYGVDPKKFKSFISVEEKVLSEKLEQLEALGEISKEDLAGCYEVKPRSSYLRISVAEEEED